MVRKNREAVKTRFPVPVRVLAASFLMALASCASVPGPLARAGDAEDPFAFLDPGGLVYLTLDAPRSRPILDLVSLGGLPGNQLGRVLDMTDTAAAAFYSPEDGRGFLLAARGRYPSSRLRFSLGLSSAWKKTRSETGGRYWRSGKDGLSIYVDPRYVLISGGDPFFRTGGLRAPERFEEFSEGAALAGWVPDAEPLIGRFLTDMRIPLGIPANLVVFGIYPAEEDAANPASRFFAKLRLELPSPGHAVALTAMIALFRSFVVKPDLPESGELPLVPLLFANVPVQEGASLILRTDLMDAEEIALLFTAFSVYSK